MDVPYLNFNIFRRLSRNYGNLKPEIIHVEQSQADLDTLVDGAGKIINEKFVPDRRPPRYLYMQKGGDLGKVENAKSRLPVIRKEVLEPWSRHLRTTWLTHLLFVCRWYHFVMNDSF